MLNHDEMMEIAKKVYGPHVEWNQQAIGRMRELTNACYAAGWRDAKLDSARENDNDED